MSFFADFMLFYFRQVSSKAEHADIRYWAPHIRNHFWYASQVCQEDSELLKVLFISSILLSNIRDMCNYNVFFITFYITY